MLSSYASLHPLRGGGRRLRGPLDVRYYSGDDAFNELYDWVYREKIIIQLDVESHRSCKLSEKLTLLQIYATLE